MLSTKFFKKFLLTLLICFSSNFLVLSADKAEGEDFNMGEMIMHHVLDDYQYEIMHGLVIPLPVILYTEENGLLIFSSSNLFDDDHVPLEEGYNGFIYYHGKYFFL